MNCVLFTKDMFGHYLSMLMEYGTLLSPLIRQNTLEQSSEQSLSHNSWPVLYILCNALVECGIETLSESREEHCLTFVATLPQCTQTKDLIPPSRKEVHGRQLPNSSNASLLSCRTTHFRKSPIPYFIELLNA